MNPKIMTALNRYENAHYKAVRKDMEAELAPEWEARRLKAAEEAWAACKAARLELESIIAEEVKK
jgi:hypothetical protein